MGNLSDHGSEGLRPGDTDVAEMVGRCLAASRQLGSPDDAAPAEDFPRDVELASKAALMVLRIVREIGDDALGFDLVQVDEYLRAELAKRGEE